MTESKKGEANDDVIELLIADDSKEFCGLIKEFFEQQEEFEITGIANNGKEALELIESNSPDILILDLIMPHLDGLGVMEELQTMDVDEKMKTIVLTAFNQEEMTQRIISLGADYYIMKPFSMDKLASRIRQIYNSSSGSVNYSQGNINNDNNQVHEQKNLSMKVTEVLHELGIPAHIKGYMYLRKAIELVIEEVNFLGAITKELYPEVADNFDTTSSRVERAIRHAIEVAWERGNTEALNTYFGNTISPENEKPTNSQFIAKIADQLRLELRAS